MVASVSDASKGDMMSDVQWMGRLLCQIVDVFQTACDIIHRCRKQDFLYRHVRTISEANIAQVQQDCHSHIHEGTQLYAALQHAPTYTSTVCVSPGLAMPVLFVTLPQTGDVAQSHITGATAVTGTAKVAFVSTYVRT